MSTSYGQSRDMSQRARGSNCAADATSPAASPTSTFWVWHQNKVPHFALCAPPWKQRGHSFKSRQLGIHLSNFTTAVVFLFFCFLSACRWKPWWRWLGNSLRNCGSIACSVHDPSPLPPLWLFSMAYTCFLFILFICFPFIGCWGGRRGRRGWGRAFWRRAKG